MIGPAKHDAEDDQDAGDDEQRVDDQVAEPPGALAAPRGQRRRERRDERGRHRAFGEQVAQQVGHAERDVEGVHLRARSPAPKIAASTVSRATPSTRLAIVAMLMRPADRAIRELI